MCGTNRQWLRVYYASEGAVTSSSIQPYDIPESLTEMADGSRINIKRGCDVNFNIHADEKTC